MNTGDKRRNTQQDANNPKRIKKECTYGEGCYRRNPAHFREFSHPHLEAILDAYSGTGPYTIPDKFSMDQVSIEEQLDMMVEKQLYTPWITDESSVTTKQSERPNGNRNGGDGGSTSSTSSQSARPAQSTSNTQVTSTTTHNSKNAPLKGTSIPKDSPSEVQLASTPLNPLGSHNAATPKGSHNSTTTDAKSSTTGSQNSTTIEGANNSTISQVVKNSKTPQGSQNSTTALQNSIIGSQNSTTALQNSTPGSQNSTTALQNSITGSQNSTTALQNSTTGSQNLTTGTQNSTTTEGANNSTISQVVKNSKTPQGSQNSQTHLYPLFTKSPTKQGVTKEPLNPQGVQIAANGDGLRSTNTDQNNSDYRPVVPPTRRASDFLTVVRPKGQMSTKHAAAAPYHIFYTTITAARETHDQPFSITFQEILDHSLGELKCSLQINFMVELGWLLAQYYFAGYSAKKLTILYGEDSPDLQTISQKKPNVDAHKVTMGSPFATHHTKMMVLCYEDGSLRVVVSTANLYLDDWENRVQGLWFSPRCPELPATSMPHEGDSPTGFKKSLLRYLNHYHSPALAFYTERVKRCDFCHINVFLVASVPGGHFDSEWGLTRMGSLLRQYCAIPSTETRQWPLIAQASSLGSFGKDPSVWLCGDFLHNFCKIKEQPQTLSAPPDLKLIYPALENVRRSHDGLLGGGCLPYGAASHTKQPWLNNYLYQWRAVRMSRDRAMPHIKTYTRLAPGGRRAAYYLLTSANCSRAAWGSINKGNAALRIMNYEAGVLFIPKFVINEDLFPLEDNARNRLVLPYDVPPVKYTSDMSPWVMDYLRM